MGDVGDECAAEDVLLSGVGLDDVAPAVAGAQPALAQAELGPLDAPQHHLQRLSAARPCIHTCPFVQSVRQCSVPRQLVPTLVPLSSQSGSHSVGEQLVPTLVPLFSSTVTGHSVAQ